jgi:predicted Rossmann fold flavoprotein
VAVQEHADRCGKKILISGGGRCNFTNLHCHPDNFLSVNPHFAKSALARYTPEDFLSLVRKHRIAYHEKTLGQLFCDNSAREILQLLETECAALGVRIFVKITVQEVTRTTEFVVRTASAEFRSPLLVVATGGLSIPKMGATSFGYDLARQFGLKIQPARPGLVPLVLGAEDRSRYCDLAGVSTEVVAACGRERFQEKMLITHRGLSGPAILQISSYWSPSEAIVIDLAPHQKLTEPFRDPKKPRTAAAIRSVFQEALPQRLANRWLELNAPASFSTGSLEELERHTHAWTVTPASTEGYEKAEVTVGGIDTDELSAKTMESQKVPGLFFIGEVVDVTGHLGGFNFQWAWASGACAGRAI